MELSGLFRDKAEQELVLNIKKATSTEETAPKQKHVRSESYAPLIIMKGHEKQE